MFKFAFSILLFVFAVAIAVGVARISMGLLYADWQLGRVGIVVSSFLIVIGASGLFAIIPKRGQAFVDLHKDKVILTFFSLLLAVGLAEILLQLFRPAAPNLVQLHDELGWVWSPNVAGWANARLGQPRYYTFVDENGLPNGIAGNGGQGILLMSDSMLQPYYDTTDAAPHAFVLNDQIRKNYRIIPGGVGGYGTDQQLLRLRALLQKFKGIADVAFFFLPLNDYANNISDHVVVRGQGKLLKPYYEWEHGSLVLKLPHIQSSGERETMLLMRSGLYRLWDELRNAMEREAGREQDPVNDRNNNFDRCLSPQYTGVETPEFSRAKFITVKLLRELKKTCESHNARLHIFVFDSPRFLSFISKGMSMAKKCVLQENFMRTIETTFQEADLPFTWLVLEEDELIPHDIHPNRAGIRKIARITMEHIAPELLK